MDAYFCVVPSHGILTVKNGAKTLQGGDITSPIVTNDQSNIYHLKNKLWRNRPHQPGILTICIRFYCDIKPTSKTLVPWLVMTTFSTTLYRTDVCMKLFNMASPKFNERGRTTCNP
jgi:hypothetical protein